ncbi:hypothetical protein BdWA1_000206 [Babesia duncani]|uniref:Uncharacterized protein n=1 Tax=Babesia duncani TaxID=323732 RepID=A0AAD9PMN2_9APIC|nr:hypothetical protein BdWA1_000206 [Babesia duncani]
MSNHEDVYFQYSFVGSFSLEEVFKIDKIKFNNEEHNFESNEGFMSVNPLSVYVYVCKVDSDFHPWLLQLVGLDTGPSSPGLSPSSEPESLSSDSSSEDDDFDSSLPTTVNYFFKLDKNGTWKNHQFTEDLTDSKGTGSIQKFEDSQAKNKLNTFKSVSGLSSASPAYYYKLTNSGSSSGQSSGSFEIQPSNLASYLKGESDKQHKYGSVSGSGSEDYEVTSFTKFSGSVPSFEIMLKGIENGSSGSDGLVSVTYHTGSGSFSGSQATISLKDKSVEVSSPVVSSAVQGSSVEVSSGSPAGSPQVSKEVSEQDSLPSVHSPPQSTQEFSSQASSSPDIIGIVCGSLIGLGGSIGVGYFAYSHLGGFAGLRSLHGNLRSLGSGFISRVYSHVSNGFSNGFSDKLLSSNLLSHFRSSSHL